MVDLCVSSVAVLDESGVILYASKAWDAVESEDRPDASPRNAQPDIFKSSRVSPSEFDEEANIKLGDDIQQILSGNETEFHCNYYYRSRADQRSFVAHAARLNLTDVTFRVLATHQDILRTRKDRNQRPYDLKEDC